jgi:hypothetical protein
LEQLVLTARVVWEEGKYIARVEGLPLEGAGDSAEQAQDELINNFRAWVELQESSSRLEESLAQAGFPGVDENTELQLEFVE